MRGRSVAGVAILGLALCVARLAGATDGGVANHSRGRVLLVNLVEPELTQSHFGLTGFSTSERKIANDWAIDAYAAESARRFLAERGYDVVLGPTDGMPGKVLKHELATLSGKPTPTAAFASWLRTAMEAAGADQAVVLQTFAREWGPTTYAQYSGYGVGSVMGDPPKHVWVFANVRALVLPRSTMKPAKGMRAIDSDCRVEIDASAIDGGSFKSWTANGLKPHEATLRSVVDRRLRQDLVSAELLPGVPEKCRVVRL